MMETRLDPDLLAAFVAVLDQGGFTAAARALNRTQSAVSMQVQRLEAVAGVKLLDRDRRRPAATPEGEAMLGYARRLLALQREALQSVARPGLRGRVRLGVMADYSATLVPPILARFAASHPGIEVEVITGLTAEMPRQLGRELDLAIVMHDAAKLDDSTGELLRYETPVWATARGHAVPQRRPLPLALSPSGCLFRAWAIAALEQAAIPWRMAYLSANYAAVEAAVRAGLAVSVFKAGTMARDLRPLGLADGFPPLPRAAICLHLPPVRAGSGPGQAAIVLREHIRVALNDTVETQSAIVATG
jgi:DNA-binding transcriptional LysR family regulator